MAQPSYDDINNLYGKYLGRSANQDEYANWLSGNYGSTELGGIEGQISSSGEAKDYSSRNTTPPTTTTTPTAPPVTVPPMNTGDANAGSGGTTTTQPTPAPTPHPPATPPSYEDINNLYTTYLGRPASQDEYGNWLSGSYGHTDLPGITTQIRTSGEGQASSEKNLTPNPLATFTGFDPSRANSDTLKYNAMNVLGSFNPNDPTAMTRAYAILNQRYPGQYTLDSQGNLMLTGTADGYIGARPIGWGSGGSWYDPSQGQYDWQWMAYNAAHPGPKGEGTGIGGAGGGTGGFGGLSTGGGTGGQGGASLLSSLQQMLGLGQLYGGPGSAGIFDPRTAGGGSNLVQQIGQDPFSQTITGALTQLMGSAGQGLTNYDAQTPIDDALRAYLNLAQGKATESAAPTQTPIDDNLAAYLQWAQGKATTDAVPNDADQALSALLSSATGHLNSTPQEKAAAFEKARMPYEMARKVQLGNASDQLANRGLLSDTTPGGGQYGGAVDRIETNLAPAFTGAVADAFGRLNQDEQNWGGILNNAVGTDTSRQTSLGNLQQGYGSLWGNAIATGNTREQQQSQAARDWAATLGNAISTGNTRENQQGQLGLGWANALGSAANAGTNRQQVLGSLAIQELQQNNEFTKFLAQYGLDRDKALADIAHGQNSELLQAFQLYLQYGQLANAGYV